MQSWSRSPDDWHDSNWLSSTFLFSPLPRSIAHLHFLLSKVLVSSPCCVMWRAAEREQYRQVGQFLGWSLSNIADKVMTAQGESSKRGKWHHCQAGEPDLWKTSKRVQFWAIDRPRMNQCFSHVIQQVCAYTVKWCNRRGLNLARHTLSCVALTPGPAR